MLEDKIDPGEFFGDGAAPSGPVPMFGLGWIPDQHGREARDD